MMLFDHKKALATVMGKRAPDGERLSGPAPMQPSEMKDEDGQLDGRHAAAQDMMAAMHEKSPMKMVHAMANFIDMHMSRAESSDEPSVPDEG